MSGSDVHALSIALPAGCLVGTLHLPAQTPQRVAVVFVTGGMQTRAGSHRGFLLLARAMAACGFAVLRFDLPGLGDSEGEPRPFDQNQDALHAAIDAVLSRVRGVERVVLWGLCDGASAAALYAPHDARVAGLMLVNPWVQSERVTAQAMVSGYYRQRLLSLAFWRKLLAGQVGILRALREYSVNWRKARSATDSEAASMPERVLQALRRFEGLQQVVVAERDLTGQVFMQVAQAGDHPSVSVVDEADHTFSSPAAHAQLEAMSLVFLETVVVRAAVAD